MKITIIVPIYNVEQYILDCLKSVALQSYKGDIECLLVDDCGNDNSIALVKSFLESYKGEIQFKILHHEHNRGLSAARNTGIEAATGEYLYFLDSDDEITPNCIESLTKPLSDKAFDMVIGDMTVVGNDKLQSALSLKLDDNAELVQPLIRHTFRKQWHMMAQNKLYRTAFVKEKELRFKEGLIHEDELWSFEVSCVLDNMKVVKIPTYIYKTREGSIISTGKRQRKTDNLTVVLKEMCSFIKERNIPYDLDIHQRIQFFFSHVMGGSNENFVEKYKELRPYTRVSLKQLLKLEGLKPALFIRDFHYVMPVCIAPYLKKATFWVFSAAEKH